MIRTLLCLLLASLTLGAADKPAGRSFLMLGGVTQIVDASGKVAWKYPAATRDGEVLPNGNLLLTQNDQRGYDKVYAADRPELFFKATPHRVVAPGDAVRIRADSSWNVPEPELTVAINSTGKIFGFTIGNDMSSRDIEGENPLYLPQAKSYHRAAAIGPCLVITDTLPAPETVIAIEIRQRFGKRLEDLLGRKIGIVIESKNARRA